jgi:hypothetical protein
MGKALGMVLMVGNLQTLAADIPLAARIIPVRSNPDHFIVLHPDFESAVLGAHHTGCFMPLVHVVLRVLRWIWILLVYEDSVLL